MIPRPGLRPAPGKVKVRPDFLLLQTVMLRSLARPLQPRQCRPLPDWPTSTTPISPRPSAAIRMVHRAIKAVLAGERYHPEGNWTTSACTARRPSGAPTRRPMTSRNWPGSYYMKERIGEVFDGYHLGGHGLRHLRRPRRGLCRGPGLFRLGPTGFPTPSSTRCWGTQRDSAFPPRRPGTGQLVRADLESNKIDFVLASTAVGRGAVVPSVGGGCNPEAAQTRRKGPASRRPREPLPGIRHRK